MPKRPSLFAPKKDAAEGVIETMALEREGQNEAAIGSTSRRPPSRAGKRVLSIYLDPLAWKQLRQLALDTETTTQALGEEAINLLFAKHRLNRSA
jgi:hypothetical protein